MNLSATDLGILAHRRFLQGIVILVAIASSFSTAAPPPPSPQQPLGRNAWLTSSFGESRGNRYHAGIDYGTEMEEGWPVLAPEAGEVEEVRISPFGYGKVLFFKGKSGNTWVLAHLSSFAEPVDSTLLNLRHRRRSNQLTHRFQRKPQFAKGDTLGWSGSTGIGNPHLHLELRSGNQVLDPCQHGISCPDSLPPVLQNLAVWDAQRPGDLQLTPQSAAQAGCVQVATELAEPTLALRAVDYSRHPTTNPMSLRRLEVRCGTHGFVQRLYSTLSYSRMDQIQEEMPWAEEAGLEGDWHLLHPQAPPTASTRSQGTLAPCLIYDSTGAVTDSLIIDLEDFAGLVSSHTLKAQPQCALPPQPSGVSPTTFAFRRHQDSLIYTFLSRPWLNPRVGCENGRSLQLVDSLDQPTVDSLCLALPRTPVEISTLLDHYPRSRKLRALHPQGERVINVHALRDSLAFSTPDFRVSLGRRPGPYFTAVTAEWVDRPDTLPHLVLHPKGLPLSGNLEVCLSPSDTAQALYWLGETSRRWFLFSNQKLQSAQRCATVNEIRDVGLMRDTVAPVPAQLRPATISVQGKPAPAIRIPIKETGSGIPHGNAVQVWQGERWIPCEYDSDPQEVVIETRFLQVGIPLRLTLEDEAGNRGSYTLPY